MRRAGLRELLRILPYRNDKPSLAKIITEHEEYKHLDEETALTICGMIGATKFMNNKEKYEHEGEYNMCLALKEMMEDSEFVEIQKGVNLSAAVFRAVNSGLTDNAGIAAKCDCTVEDVEKIRSAFGL